MYIFLFIFVFYSLYGRQYTTKMDLIRAVGLTGAGASLIVLAADETSVQVTTSVVTTIATKDVKYFIVFVLFFPQQQRQFVQRWTVVDCVLSGCIRDFHSYLRILLLSCGRDRSPPSGYYNDWPRERVYRNRFFCADYDKKKNNK